MDFMTNDDHKDEIIRKAASDYNRPPATPHAEMWTAIQAACSAPASGPRLHVMGGGPAVPARHTQNRFASHYTWLGAAAAAVLLVATGIGIGRMSSTPVQTAPIAAAKPTSTVATIAPQAAPNVEPGPSTVVAPIPSSERSASPGEFASTPRTREGSLKSPRIIGTGKLRPLGDSRNEPYPVSSFAATNVSYQVATQKHLEDAEALLTSFALEGHDARTDAQFAGWAKGLLSNTRLLLDSPAGNDPRRAKLLGDLELVLAQIVQLSPNAPAQDRELIQGSIQNGHVLTRLRAATPADQPRGIQEK
jgi:hypothetical protein